MEGLVIITKNEQIDVSEMDREVAILIFNGKVYEDVNHQYALEVALMETGIPLKLNIENDIDKVAELTHIESMEGNMCTLDIFIDHTEKKYLVSHFESNLEKFKNIIDEYLIGKNMILGTFIDFNSKLVKLI